MKGRNIIAIEKNDDELFKEDKVDYIEIMKERLELAWKDLILHRRIQ